MPRRSRVQNTDGSTSSKDNVIWTPEMDNVLVDAMLEEEHKGNRPSGAFTTTAYDNMLHVLTTTFGKHIQKINIKNRTRTLKKTFGECKDLFHGLSGFAWNPTTKMFDAESEVWEHLIEAKPEARRWRYTPIENYNKLYELFGEQRATGEYAESAAEKVARWQREGSSSQFDLNEDVYNFMMSDGEGYCATDMPNNENLNSPEYAPSINSQGTSSSKGTKRKASMMEMLATQYEKLNANFERVSNALERGNESVSDALQRGNVIAERGNDIAERSLTILESGRPHYYKEEQIYTELEKIGVLPEFLMDAYCYLSNNPATTRSFFGVPRGKRLEWLMKVMGNL
ncbi:hypothetical protein PTKIN_Ptkin05aG0121400 [Pterospermum kingtungense]